MQTLQYRHRATGRFPADIRKDRPDTSFGEVIDPDTADHFGYDAVYPVDAPEPAPGNRVESGAPVLVGEQWQTGWVEVALTEAEIVAEITIGAQRRLDEFAMQRDYDSMLSACTYATSAVPLFRAEGQACVNGRDATWTKLYEILAEVQSGSRPVPTGYAAIEAELPVLAWTE